MVNSSRCCFPAGYKVVTARGMVSIQQGNELVYTHKGRVRKVRETVAHWYTGAVYSIKSYGTSNYETTCTHTHPFYTKRGWVKAEDLTTNDWLLFPINNTTNDVTTISVPYVKKIANQFGILETIMSLDIKLEFELLTIIGYYLAERHLTKGYNDNYSRITFTFSSSDNDIKHVDSLVDSITKLGFTPH